MKERLRKLRGIIQKNRCFEIIRQCVHNYYFWLILFCTAITVFGYLTIRDFRRENTINTGKISEANIPKSEAQNKNDHVVKVTSGSKPAATKIPAPTKEPIHTEGPTKTEDGADKEESEKKVYLTFDDGPSSQTGKILDILDKYHVKATFFVVGKTDDKSIALYKRIVKEGHTIGIHSYSHKYKQIYGSVNAFVEDFTKMKQYLDEVTGLDIRYYRFPGGSANSFAKKNVMDGCIRYLNKEGIRYYDWNVLNGDATNQVLTEDKLIANIVNGVKQKRKSVVLMHDADDKEDTVKSLPKLIGQLNKMKVSLLPIDDNAPLMQQIKSDSAEE